MQESKEPAAPAQHVASSQRSATPSKKKCAWQVLQSLISKFYKPKGCVGGALCSRFGYFRAIKADRRYYADMGHVVRGTSSQSAATAAAAAVRACR